MTIHLHLRTAFYLLLSTLLFLTSACSQQPAKSVATEPSLTQSPKPIPSTWNIKAKLGIRSTSNSGSVNLHWQQQGDQYRLRITGPLGQGGGIITGNNKQILIKRSGKPPLSSDSPEKLIRQTFGWDFPLRDLSYWIRGLPSPFRPNTQLEYKTNGSLTSLKQAVWSIGYERYTLVDQWLMPTLVRTEKDGVTLKLIIKQWQFPETKRINNAKP